MKRRICVKFMEVCVGFVLIALAVMTIVSCGEEIPKAITVSQVEDAHFKYEDIQFEFIKKVGTRKEWSPAHRTMVEVSYDYFVVYFLGKITNNSGVNLLARFQFLCDGKYKYVHITRRFAVGQTITFDRYLLDSFSECDDITLEYQQGKE